MTDNEFNHNDDAPASNPEAGDSTDKPKGQYEVGYGKPPTSTRFKKEQSGNKKGRPKGQQNFATMLRKAVGEPITIREGGKSRTMSKGDAAIIALVHRALSGNDRAFGKLVELLQKAGAFKNPDVEEPKCGVLVVDKGCATSAEWVARYGTAALSTIEGIDAYERAMLKACEEMRRRARDREAWLKELEERYGKKEKLLYPNAID